MNRISNAIAKMESQIAERVAQGLTTQAAVDKCAADCNLDVVEYCKFQELKSFAHASGVLTFDEATTVFGYLGEGGPEHFNRQPVAVKVILTKLFAELLGAKIGAKRRQVA